MGIALEIVKIAVSAIPDDVGPAAVKRVNLQVGRLSAVVPESLVFCFEIVARGTPLEGAELAIEEVPVVACCNDCGARWTVKEAAFCCEECGSGSLHLLSGRELLITSIEVPD